jgi:hypothetical protein
VDEEEAETGWQRGGKHVSEATNQHATVYKRRWDYTSNIRKTKRKQDSFHQQFLDTW